MNLHHLIACHECDLLHERHSISEGYSALCRRCGATLFRAKADMLNRSLALNLSALIFFMVAVSLPFLGIEAKGISVDITLFNAVDALYDHKMRLMSAVVWVVLLAAPAFRIVGMLFVLLPLYLNRSPAYLKKLFHLVEVIRPWSMVEVFLIGILVTFVKLGDLATIFLRVSFWAFVAMVVVLIVADLAVDRHQIWDRISPGREGA